MFKFLRSSHKLFYMVTALKFRCSPDLVYDIAHNRQREGDKVSEIRKYLLDKKIISRVKRRHRKRHDDD